jgi:hypothetical protein
MNETSAVITVVAISVALSSATVYSIQAPLRRLLESICPIGTTAEFWTRAAMVLLFLFPLWAVLVIGLPDLEIVGSYSGGEIARRGLAWSSLALVVIVVATGLRLNATRPVEAVKTDYLGPAPR